MFKPSQGVSMSNQHQWCTYSKGRIHITGCAGCGQILLPSNSHTNCIKIPEEDNMLLAKGYEITQIMQDQEVA